MQSFFGFTFATRLKTFVIGSHHISISSKTHSYFVKFKQILIFFQPSSRVLLLRFPRKQNLTVACWECKSHKRSQSKLVPPCLKGNGGNKTHSHQKTKVKWESLARGKAKCMETSLSQHKTENLLIYPCRRQKDD